WLEQRMRGGRGSAGRGENDEQQAHQWAAQGWAHGPGSSRLRGGWVQQQQGKGSDTRGWLAQTRGRQARSPLFRVRGQKMGFCRVYDRFEVGIARPARQ